MQRPIKTIFSLSCLMMTGFNHADEAKASGEGVTLNIGGRLTKRMSCTLSSATYELKPIPVQDFDGKNEIDLGIIQSKDNVRPLKNCRKNDKFDLHMTLITKTYVNGGQDYYGYVPLKAVEGSAQGVRLYVYGYSKKEPRKNFQRLVNDSAKGVDLFLEKEIKEAGGQITPGEIRGEVTATLTPA